ncbi:hypothetical protein GA0111570_11065 [Raineyella antarctica]|uniref:Uncharacterized protein n=1 Tax=Raineyella antarctica TaxID=1577474 RepID=A0A1G6HHM2_9ACTN|nr:hypothetical protein [Raineyella antarctica]SDB93750.1 hypothetical protein GA0111570_11065 [Raineyella antarctica]
MYADLIIFDGPRSPELVAAADFADTRRIRPLIDADQHIRGDILASFDLRQRDGGRAVLVITGSEATLDALAEVVMTSELMPGEDPTLLPGPTRAERYTVFEASVKEGADLRRSPATSHGSA